MVSAVTDARPLKNDPHRPGRTTRFFRHFPPKTPKHPCLTVKLPVLAFFASLPRWKKFTNPQRFRGSAAGCSRFCRLG